MLKVGRGVRSMPFGVLWAKWFVVSVRHYVFIPPCYLGGGKAQ